MTQAGNPNDAEYRPGVGVMLLNDEGRVFVGRRVDVPDEAWQMPQGGIREDETPRAAAYRELQEEIGTEKAEILAESTRWYRYDLPPELIGKAWRGRWRGQRQKWFVMRFTGHDRDINVRTKDAEFSEWKWVDIDKLLSFVVSFKRQVYLDLFTEFAELTGSRGQSLSALVADPIVRMTMAADNVGEDELLALLRRISKKLSE